MSEALTLLVEHFFVCKTLKSTDFDEFCLSIIHILNKV